MLFAFSDSRACHQKPYQGIAFKLFRFGSNLLWDFLEQQMSVFMEASLKWRLEGASSSLISHPFQTVVFALDFIDFTSLISTYREFCCRQLWFPNPNFHCPYQYHDCPCCDGMQTVQKHARIFQNGRNPGTDVSRVDWRFTNLKTSNLNFII